MPLTGNLNALTERLRDKTEGERLKMEAIFENELTVWQKNLQCALKNALATTGNDIQTATRKLRETAFSQMKILSWSFGRRWLMTALLALAGLFGLSLGGWGLMKAAELKAINLYQKISQLNQQKEQLETTLTQLRGQTWGLALSETPEGRFIILPPGTTLKTGWTIGQQPAAKME